MYVRKFMFSIAIAGGALCLAVAASGGTAQGAEGAGSGVAGALSNGESVCTPIEKLIGEGTDSKVVVRTAIELGHSPCKVVQCALAVEGPLDRVLSGAVEAGAPTDVISRCAIDAGADAAKVAEILTRPDLALSLCYFQPDDSAEFLVLPVALPRPVRRDPFPAEKRSPAISPYTFP